MSFNRFMHPRNVFRVRPNYEELGAIYADFREILIQKPSSGKWTIDFSDPNSLRILTIVLLHYYFKVNVSIPPDRLIPAVPQRVNYLLWVEDMVNLLDLKPPDDDNIIGLDIGTGPCCIFPILGCRLNKKLKFIATETDDLSHAWAVNNVEYNNLQDRITVVKVNPDTYLTDIPGQSTLQAHFLMCNPPFFKDRHQIDMDIGSMDDSNDSSSRSSANTSSEVEAVTQGGEVEFVKKIIQESVRLGESIKIYSVMLGHKRSSIELMDYIKSSCPKISNSVINRFYQGKTIRWGLAWTFIPGIDLNQTCTNMVTKPKQSHKPLEFQVPQDLKETNYSVQSIYRAVRILLRDKLNIKNVDILKENNRYVEMIIRSNQNTWSHQRRQRRMMKRSEIAEKVELVSTDIDMDIESEPLPISSEDRKDHLNPPKRKHSDDDESLEKVTPNQDEIESKKLRDEKDILVPRDEENFLLDCSCSIKRVSDRIIITMKTQDRAKSSEATHQLLQYFKNNIS
ncbi:U6 small nuclear RNA (adenine-(43)-N(6))-methyltransferase [Brevipalpus obovatus]|uniref:U6 small nuclear RNA (adenine-(43)-N(6))-methyltransferase n=1 Tax=Brevipalpus obovatus TaxID=246614 RepID=UPI003D9F8573